MFSALVLAAAAQPCRLHPQLQLAAAVARARVTPSKTFDASADVTLTLRTLSPAIAVRDPGARAHADGYYVIARRLEQRSHVRAVGTSKAQATARLKRAIAALVRDANAEYARQILVYETVTDNGRMQSQGPAWGFPGGPNAAAFCPA